MPLQNRMLPTGEIVAHPARGLFVGNRGRLHLPGRVLGGRRWTTHCWVTCLLQFRGRHREVMGNGWTELFFLDEAVALSAGHRPCAECRRADYRRFQAAWRIAHGEPATAPAMNARLHADRVEGGRTARSRTQRRHTATVADLPDGTFVLAASGPALVAGGLLHPYDPAGYGPAETIDPAATVTVLTPRCTVAVLRAGYRPVLALG
ncbi:MAG: hypothetical protein IT555_01150 [Acetobacteraceae bacterium]|nr:hypothetical protein [Acetobacteraceae bacterium]